MKTARAENKGVTQTSKRNVQSSSAAALRPDSGKTETPGRSTLLSHGLGASAARPIATPSHEQITERAKAIWAQNGRMAGQDQANWYEAEAQLKAEL